MGRYLPVFIADVFDVNQIGKLNPVKIETPKMNKFLGEFMFTRDKFDMPTAVIIPGHKENKTYFKDTC